MTSYLVRRFLWIIPVILVVTLVVFSVSRILPGYTKVNMHFGLIDKPKRKALNWNGDKRRSFKPLGCNNNIE